jgi:hypothetical protein
MEKFSTFLLNEEKSYLGKKVGNVLSSLQNFQSDVDNLGSRQLSRLSEEIVNQIRLILHQHWNPKYNNQLKELQKIAVAIQKTIEDRGDLKQVIPAALSALSNLSGRLGVKVNNLNAPETQDSSNISPEEFQSTGEQPDFSKKKPQQIQGQPQGQPQGNQPLDQMTSQTEMPPTGGLDASLMM